MVPRAGTFIQPKYLGEYLSNPYFVLNLRVGIECCTWNSMILLEQPMYRPRRGRNATASAFHGRQQDFAEQPTCGLHPACRDHSEQTQSTLLCCSCDAAAPACRQCHCRRQACTGRPKCVPPLAHCYSSEPSTPLYRSCYATAPACHGSRRACTGRPSKGRTRVAR
jgi:hypothetical protein